MHFCWAPSSIVAFTVVVVDWRMSGCCCCLCSYDFEAVPLLERLVASWNSALDWAWQEGATFACLKGGDVARICMVDTIWAANVSLACNCDCFDGHHEDHAGGQGAEKIANQLHLVAGDLPPQLDCWLTFVWLGEIASVEFAAKSKVGPFILSLSLAARQTANKEPNSESGQAIKNSLLLIVSKCISSATADEVHRAQVRQMRHLSRAAKCHESGRLVRLSFFLLLCGCHGNFQGTAPLTRRIICLLQWLIMRTKRLINRSPRHNHECQWSLMVGPKSLAQTDTFLAWSLRDFLVKYSPVVVEELS